jgi:DNA-binding response OmpR family regulator
LFNWRRICNKPAKNRAAFANNSFASHLTIPIQGTMRILVVEDDASVRETLGMVLEAHEHVPLLVDDGEQALEFLKKEWPEVLLLDLTLPVMSGEDLFHEILVRFGRVPPTVVLSAAQEGESRTRHLAGALFLAKPFTIEQLAEMVETAASGGRCAAIA